MAFEAPYILHMFTPGRQMSPFDINMAADAGYQMVVPYSDVGLDNVTALTQDTIFSRGPKGVARTGIFIGGRDAMVAADMTDRAVASMVPPFSVSVMADPSGGYTTAAAMVACVEAAVLKVDPKGLAGQRMLIIGAGPVGRIAGVLAAQAGAEVRVSSHRGLDAANRAAQETNQRFGVSIGGVSGADAASLRMWRCMSRTWCSHAPPRACRWPPPRTWRARAASRSRPTSTRCRPRAWPASA